MSHAECWELLAVYRDLGAAERAEVDAHLRACPECAARLLAWRTMDRDLAALPDPLPAGRLDARFCAAVRRRPRASLLHRAGQVANALAWAAVAVVAALLVAGLVIAGRPLVEQAWPAAQPTATPAPGLGRVIVGDELITSYHSATQQGNWPDLAPQLSPDGTRVAYLPRDSKPGVVNLLIVRNLVTGREEWRGPLDGALYSSLRWRPDSRSLAFVATREREGGGASSNLFRLDLEQRRTWLEALWAGILRLLGRSRPQEPVLQRLYGADDPHAPSGQPALGIQRWTPDGRAIEAFVTTGEPGLRVRADGRGAEVNALPFTPDRLGAAPEAILSVPLPAPAGDYWLAVVRTSGLTQRPEGAPAGGESLVRYDMATGQAHVLASFAVRTYSNELRISPDGEWIALLATGDDGATQSWFVRRDGTGLRQVALSGGAFAWAAPGRIYFSVPPRQAGEGVLYELDLASGQVGLVADAWPEQTLIAAAPDGSGLLTVRRQGGMSELHWLRLAPRPQDEPAPTLAPTSAPQPTASAAPTLRPTRTPTPTATPPPCLAPVTPQPPAPRQPLRVVYADGGRLWRWQEETGAATAYALSGPAYDARLSRDGHLIAFRRPTGEWTDELWVVGADGTGERRLATFSAVEMVGRYPTTGLADLVVDWLPGAHTLACYYEPDHRYVEYGPYEPLTLVDADTGAARTVTAAEDRVLALAYAPDGSQVAVLTAQELRLVDARDGSVRFRAPLQVQPGRSQSLAYAPDGRSLALFTERAITVVDTAAGSRRDIPFDYEPIGMGEYSTYPRINWLADGTAFYTTFSQGNATQVIGEGATFTLWRVDVAAASASALGSYDGSFLGSWFSPDRRWLAYPVRHADNTCELYLVDAQEGRQVCYAQGGWIGLRGWSPDPARFVYQQGGRVTLGSICQPPQVLAGVQRDEALGWYDTVWWVDSERFLTVNGSYTTELWTLRLNALDGTVTIIATLHSHQARYGYYLGG
ncbi:MAG TPA: zf-HC2 domain-containing protein [Anaerolineae bacterium]|nr:zf-HC2 domain-containing protein [Anaerolineae bacterium]HOR00457.1 zf-HC2 domain-containing protein [Anaerolineae bacterium]HPL28402.1 zf-HC2 domain-containing protein [Anaerolineae bacterium]